jgi:hypothetical protein
MDPGQVLAGLPRDHAPAFVAAHTRVVPTPSLVAHITNHPWSSA